MKTRRAGFTLFELILAIALAATLLALIGMAINLYLMRVDADRTRVEEAQLARSVLSMIADDIRGASVYQKQDTSAVAQLMAASTPFNVDSIDSARQSASAATATGASGANSAAALGSLSGGSGASSAAGASGSAGGASSASSQSANQETDDTMPLGLNGSSEEVFVDVTRIPRQDELFATVTGYTNAPSASEANTGSASSSATTSNVNPPADLKTVHYFIRPGEAVTPGSIAVTSLDPNGQAAAGGLVRQEIPRRMRVFAEQNGSSGVLDEGAVLVAPEVVQIQFRYYDGSQLVDTWDMKELKKLPMAIEVSISLKSARAGAANADYSSQDTMNGSHTYRQVVGLPMGAISAASAGESSADGSTSGSSSSSSSSTGQSSTPSSSPAFGDQ
jgi:hypothetical protein